MLAQTISGVTNEKNKMLILLPLVSTIFIVAFYGSDHSGVDGKKTNLTP